jgi:hypothetical protein
VTVRAETMPVVLVTDNPYLSLSYIESSRRLVNLPKNSVPIAFEGPFVYSCDA